MIWPPKTIQTICGMRHLCALFVMGFILMPSFGHAQTRRTVSYELIAGGSTTEGLRLGIRIPTGKTFGLEAAASTFFSDVSGSAGVTFHLAPSGDDVNDRIFQSPFSDISLLGHYYIGTSHARYGASLLTGILNTRTFGPHLYLRAGVAVFANANRQDIYALPAFEAGLGYSF